jgi:hypothetical protein
MRRERRQEKREVEGMSRILFSKKHLRIWSRKKCQRERGNAVMKNKGDKDSNEELKIPSHQMSIEINLKFWTSLLFPRRRLQCSQEIGK